MSENRKRLVINADRVIINADEVFIVEAEDKRRRGRFNQDVAGVENRRDRRYDRDDDVLGAEDRRRRRGFPW
ncbi:hypothetical protein [Metabacillus litoralis]|uniref:hypothetical protein n=1 Tax=Metabacillus litoralis TaxID=152268 RepID=UPI000EF5E6BE|nr:hypothetical protein [Metabacillus litoralis]